MHDYRFTIPLVFGIVAITLLACPLGSRRGQGSAELAPRSPLRFAGRLARFALDDAVKSGKRIVPVCSYIAAFVRKNHDWDAHLEHSGDVSSDDDQAHKQENR